MRGERSTLYHRQGATRYILDSIVQCASRPPGNACLDGKADDHVICFPVGGAAYPQAHGQEQTIKAANGFSPTPDCDGALHMCSEYTRTQAMPFASATVLSLLLYRNA
jgi:hypothetical protein